MGSSVCTAAGSRQRVVSDRAGQRRHGPLRAVSLALLGVPLALFGCTTSALEWRIRFENVSDRDETRVVRASVRRGTCDGEVLWEGTIAQGMALEGMSVPALAPGRYALDVTATDALCRTLASSCVLVSAPFRESVLVDLPSRPAPALCAATACRGGTCDCSMGACADAGPGDADVLDAGGTASSPDAFSESDAWTGDDVGPVDAFVAPDAFIVPPAAPVVVAPWNGVSTGAPVTDSTLEDPPLRPEFFWRAVPSAGSYVLELTRCDRADWTTCFVTTPDVIERFAGDVTRGRPSRDLDVSTSRPVGARYVFRIGACTTTDHRGCAYSAPRYLDVGRSSTDLDGDGASDLLAVARGADAQLVRVTGGASPTLEARFTADALGPVTAIGDYDGDGVAEAAVTTSSALGGRWLYVDDLVQAGSDESTTPTARLGERLLRLGDVDGDGYADFFVSALGIGQVRIQLGGPVFDAARRATFEDPGSVSLFAYDVCAPGDVNGDGNADLAIAMNDGVETSYTQVRLYTVTASGTIRELPTTTRIRVATGFVGAVPDMLSLVEIDCGGDIDGDGVPDFVFGQHRVNQITLHGARDVFLAGTNQIGYTLALGDVDGSGRLAIVATRDGYRSTPLGTLIARYDLATSPLVAMDLDTEESRQLSIGDYDGDGRDDVGIFGPSLRVHTAGASTILVAPPSGRTWSVLGN